MRWRISFDFSSGSRSLSPCLNEWERGREWMCEWNVERTEYIYAINFLLYIRVTLSVIHLSFSIFFRTGTPMSFIIFFYHYIEIMTAEWDFWYWLFDFHHGLDHGIQNQMYTLYIQNEWCILLWKFINRLSSSFLMWTATSFSCWDNTNG